MSAILNTLKDKFSDIYDLLSNNSGENNLIFFAPSPSFYTSDSLEDRSFFYSHIFKKSNYNPDLYVNFLGKVMKSVDKKKFVTELGFKKKFELNVKGSYMHNGKILSFNTDGICIDGEKGNDMDVVEGDKEKEKEKEKNNEFVFKRCLDSKEYINYYNNEELTREKYKKFIKGKSNLDKFIYAMKNNNILMKESEEAYGDVFTNSVSKLINYFSDFVFLDYNGTKNQSEQEQLKIAASEFVDSYIFNELYDDVMEKFKEFYKEEESQLKQKLKENKTKYSVDELKLPNSTKNCKFNSAKKYLSNISLKKTYFEKMKFLTEINEQLIKEFDDNYKKETGKEFDKDADFMNIFWMHILANFQVDNLISEALFLETLKFQNEKGQDGVIVNSFIIAANTIKNEMLRNEKDINVFMVKPFVVTTQE